MNRIINGNLWHKFNKRRKINNFTVSGTEVKNYLLKDPILDWFEYCYNKSPKSIDTNMPLIGTRKRRHSQIEKSENIQEEIINKKDNLSILFDKGNKFESYVSNILHNKFGNNMITINTESHQNAMTNANFDKTIDAMMEGIPIIEQAVLFNYRNNTRGIADLLVRSDYINKIVNRPVLDEYEETIKAPNLNGKYHYVVIDIKWSCLSLCSNGKYIRNTDRYPAYKGQLAIYTNAIGIIQGYIPNKAFILGKNWKIYRKNNNDINSGNDCFELLGVIDYSSKFDSHYIEETTKAIEWVKDVKENGHNWDIKNPHRPELYPNMCNKNESKWNKLKEEFAKNIGEITLLWNVNIKHREMAHQNGIRSWKNSKCNANQLGIYGNTKKNIINRIIKVNRTSSCYILPKYIKKNTKNWKEKTPLDFYIDFETLNVNLCDDISNFPINREIIFFIGVGYEEYNRWKYKSFICKSISLDEEYKNINKFIDFINTKSQELDKSNNYIPRLFHWTRAEMTGLNLAGYRHSTDIWKEWETNICWVDLHRIFIDEPIAVKGAFDYRLKSIGKAMYNNKFIKTNWDDDIADGFTAMQKGIQYYRSLNEDKNNKENKKIIRDITKYNKIDCKIMWDITEYLRKNHIKKLKL